MEKQKNESESRLERVPVLIFENSTSLARHAASRIADVVREKRTNGLNAVLGLPTGSTPIGVYQELVRMHREDGLDLSNVVSFNLDEYFPISADSLQSYHRFMFENFFDHVNVPRENIHIPRGDIGIEDVEAHCIDYERQIADAGGIDLLLLGIGRSGHVGFNEPGSAVEDRTRLIVLDEITRKDAASDFFDEKNVPLQAITMGVGTILEAREIILMATGEHKAPIIQRAVEEKQSSDVSATYLQMHPNTTFYLDRASASQLTREQTPWLVRHVEWTEALAKRAVIWLSEETGKPIQWLDASDFHRHHLHDLVHGYSSVDQLCQLIYEDLRRRITYGHELPKQQRILVFSPHPDDDVISMGGVLGKMVGNGNDVVVAYMTNGSVAVFDDDVRRHLRFVEMCSDALLGDDKFDEARSKISEMIEFLDSKEPAQVDLPLVQNIKAYIRYTEAISAIEVVGLGPENARFLDMPFYKTGRVKKDPISAADVRIVSELLRELKPDHVFVAGDLSDPHGTHRMCYKAIKQAVEECYGPSELDGSRSHLQHHPEIDRPLIWLYRGAWQEWEIDKADVFLPLSRADLDQKIEAIYKHESQKDRALFPGAYDTREFWQRARDRNRDTAKAIDSLGLPQFYAVEAFVTSYNLP